MFLIKENAFFELGFTGGAFWVRQDVVPEEGQSHRAYNLFAILFIWNVSKKNVNFSIEEKIGDLIAKRSIEKGIKKVVFGEEYDKDKTSLDLASEFGIELITFTD